MVKGRRLRPALLGADPGRARGRPPWPSDNTRIEIKISAPFFYWPMTIIVWGGFALFVYLWFIVVPQNLDRPQPFYLLIAFIFGTPFMIYDWLKHWLGKITIDISPKVLRHRFQMGSITLTDNTYETDLLSGFEIGRGSSHPLFIRSKLYYLEFLHGFKPKKINFSYYGAEAKVILSKIEQALQPG